MGNASEPVQLQMLGNGKERMSLMDRLADELTSNGWDSNEVYGVQMAMEEAVSNAYRHGNHNGERGNVDIHWHTTAADFVMHVSDQGDGFDDADVPDPTAPENLEKMSGRGLLLMRHYMDEVDFRDGGRTVVMRKQRCVKEGSGASGSALTIASQKTIRYYEELEFTSDPL